MRKHYNHCTYNRPNYSRILARRESKVLSISAEICLWTCRRITWKFVHLPAVHLRFRDAERARRVAMRRDANTTQGCGERKRGSRRPARRSYAGKSKEAVSYQWYVCARIHIRGEAAPLNESKTHQFGWMYRVAGKSSVSSWKHNSFSPIWTDIN